MGVDYYLGNVEKQIALYLDRAKPLLYAYHPTMVPLDEALLTAEYVLELLAWMEEQPPLVYDGMYKDTPRWMRNVAAWLTAHGPAEMYADNDLDRAPDGLLKPTENGGWPVWQIGNPICFDVPTLNAGHTHTQIRAVDWTGNRGRTNQPCRGCGAEDGTFQERGFSRCKTCGYPGQ